MATLLEFNSIVNLLESYRIRIPAIQRNYVHGRDGKREQEIREHFVDSFLELVAGKVKKISLDFVYGCLEDSPGSGAVQKLMIPIDGQQRMTTLWLLSVYFARQKCEDSFDIESIFDRLSRFEYTGRPLANAFCKWLVSKSAKNAGLTRQMLDAVASEWIADPTIDSMIRTLRCVLEKCSSLNEIAKARSILFGASEDVKMSFFFMPIDGVGNADDFYVKQNARGKSLTQWENFKGMFSALIGGENSPEREEFDRRIECLSDRYYMVFKGDTWELPDDPFLGIFVRVIDYELRREGCLYVVHLAEGANWTFNGDEEFPYVVFDENVLRERGLAKKIARPVLDLIEWSLRDDVTKRSLYYWNEGKDLIPKVVFSPTANNHVDFSLILYEYFSRYELKGGESCGLNENDFRALRLVANILANTNRDAKDEHLICAHFNRVKTISSLFIEKSPTMYAAIDVEDDKDSAQCHEEALKSRIYSRGYEEEIRELQLCELNMHGKVRIALWNLSDKSSSRIMYPDFVSRIKKLNHEYFGRWGRGDVCTRREIQFKLIDCLPRDLSTSFVVCHTIYPDRRLREWLSKPGNEKSYQQLLECREKSSIVNHESCYESWRRDWRIVLKKLLSDTSLVDADRIRGRSFDDWEVRRHSYTGQLYLYYGANISGAFPVADWRSDLFLTKDEAGRRLSLKTKGVCMTGDCYDAHWYKDPTSKSGVYLYRDSVSVVPINCDNDEDHTRKKIIPYGMNGVEGILSEILKAEKELMMEANDE